MIDFIKDFFKTLAKFINNNNYVNFISIIVVAVSSYRIAKYNTLKPSKLKIKQLQLSNVYLPLYRIFENAPEPITKRQALEISKKITNILDKNYELAFPQLHILNKSFKHDIINSNSFLETLNIMKHQVNIDYEILKKSLGYPSDNFYNIYIRMTFKQRATFIISWLNVFWLFGPLILFVVFAAIFPENSVFITLIIFALIFLTSILMWKVNKWLKNLKD